MPYESSAIVIAWWQLAMAANALVSVTYVAVGALILVPTARSHQLRTNKLAVATGAVFLSCAVGHGLTALKPLLSVLQGRPGGLDHPINWWLASWQTLTAFVGLYYLTLRKLYGRLLTSIPQGGDLVAQQPLADGEQLATVDAARVKAEGERDAQAAMLLSIIQNSHSMIYVKDLDGRYLLTNGLFEDRVGLPKDQILGRTDADLDPEVAPSRHADDLRAREGLYELEEWRETPDGRHCYETAKFPVFDGEGVLYATCGISQNVTEQRKAAAAQAVERDAALAATAAKSAFLATMSHEIRTPMNAVIGMTDLMLGTELDDHQLEFVQTIRGSGDALLALINDILDFTKIESGELELESVPFDLRAEAEASIDLVLATATSKGIELVCDIEQDCPAFVIGDVHRIRQILANLLSNAVKFTARGDVLLTIATERIGDGKVRVLASVADTGIGIAPENEDRLFRSFSQVDASTTRVYGGTGLGLAISRRLAEAMGGELRLASTSPAGSTFVLEVVLPGSATSADADEQVAATVPYLVGKSALLVDDNRTNLRILELQLSGLGMTCATFDSPQAALARVADDLRYDVAVLDMHMPEMDGVSLGVALRELPHGSDAPLVLLTSLGWKPAGLEQTFAGFLTKPAKRAALHQTLVRALQGRQDQVEQVSVKSTTAAQPLRILLAEDNLVNQRVAQLMLDQLGHRVDTVSNGLEAVKAVTSRPYDVVLMDVQMPQMDGLEATRRICSQVSADELPHIVALTANALSEDRDACIAAGMPSYLSKPVRLQELEAILSRSAAGPREELRTGAASGFPIDEEVLQALTDQLSGDPHVRKELVDQYLTEADHQVLLLSDMVAAGDQRRIRSITHTWRSTSALLGARRLADLLQQLEESAKNSPANCGQLFEETAAEYERVKEWLVGLGSATSREVAGGVAL